MQVHVLERPELVPLLKEQRSPDKTQQSLAWRMSPLGGLAGCPAPVPLVLRGWGAESWPVLGIAEKLKKCLWFWLLPRDVYPCSDSPPHHYQALRLYPQFLQAFWLTKLAWPRGNEAFIFFFFCFCFMQSCICLSCPATVEKMSLLDLVVPSHHSLRQL